MFDAQRNEVPVIADPLLFEQVKKTYHQKLLNNEMTGSVWPKYGTAAMIQFCHAVGALPTNGFSREILMERMKFPERHYMISSLAEGAIPPTPACPAA